ncbi:hypothetical protein CDD81_2915 [Ophiocordyceps australis]|uniref:Putative lipoate-protein ligase A n=1 Tax=Ophiocordyceps australis TaxID=1399860 RepID=A0A2C5YHF7_9HYPO|nr:hypothetical protein CDD81_2915 [Ophiocordyceps australis]
MSLLGRHGQRLLRAGCGLSHVASSWANSTQIWISRSHDALLNLCVEHHLLQVTPPQSRVLLVYVNAPCIVVGRNQNPWREADLHLLASLGRASDAAPDAPQAPRLVRRRSGGGAVFHDEGNANYCVICPSADFDRDRHANMVVAALHALGRRNTRVNQRHDIVMTGADSRPYKISGSAYKLTRQRALHHGTCLLHSPSLHSIAKLLDSPAKPFLAARGVESVSSPVRNAGLTHAEFEQAVVTQFGIMYGAAKICSEFGPETLSEPKIKAAYQELQSREWLFGQTPRFVFDTHTQQPPFPQRVAFEAKHGIIEHFELHGCHEADTGALLGRRLYDIDDWTSWLARAGMEAADSTGVGAWMNRILGTRFTKFFA